MVLTTHFPSPQWNTSVRVTALEQWLDLKGNIWITGIILHTAEGMQEIK